MKKGRYIIYIAVPVLLGMFSLLVWNAQRLFLFEKEQLRERVEWCVKSAADSIQNYNGSLLNNQAKMATDPRYSDKVSFAAGFTHNMGKLSIALYEDTSGPPAYAPVKDTVHPEKDSIPLFTEHYIKTQVKFKPEAVMGVHHFDSVFRKELLKKNAVIPYAVQTVIPYAAGGHQKGREKPLGDTIASSLFILDFTEPIMYSVHFTVPARIVYGHMFPYLLSTAFLCLLLVSGTIFFYRGYRSQQQQAQFRESLFGNITHELKTPLTSLQLIVDNAKESLPGNTTVSLPSKHIRFAENELNRMKLIVDKILSFTKLSSEQFAFNKERVDLDNTIMEAIAAMEINTQQAGGIINYEEGKKVTVLGDPILLINAVSTIIDNALKYTSRQPVIDVQLIPGAQYATIAIHDNGIGIPKHLSKKVFEPFFRVPTGNVYNTSGHGLGLSFVQQVMKVHGGSVSFISNDEGTTFYLKFKVS